MLGGLFAEVEAQDAAARITPWNLMEWARELVGVDLIPLHYMQLRLAAPDLKIENSVNVHAAAYALSIAWRMDRSTRLYWEKQNGDRIERERYPDWQAKWGRWAETPAEFWAAAHGWFEHFCGLMDLGCREPRWTLPFYGTVTLRNGKPVDLFYRPEHREGGAHDDFLAPDIGLLAFTLSAHGKHASETGYRSLIPRGFADESLDLIETITEIASEGICPVAKPKPEKRRKAA